VFATCWKLLQEAKYIDVFANPDGTHDVGAFPTTLLSRTSILKWEVFVVTMSSRASVAVIFYKLSESCRFVSSKKTHSGLSVNDGFTLDKEKTAEA